MLKIQSDPINIETLDTRVYESGDEPESLDTNEVLIRGQSNRQYRIVKPRKRSDTYYDKMKEKLDNVESIISPQIGPKAPPTHVQTVADDDNAPQPSRHVQLANAIGSSAV